MLRHIVQIIALTFVLLLCLFLPYLPGDFDGMSVALSTMTQLLGFASLLLVPIGILWLVYEFRRASQISKPRSKDRGFSFGFVSLAVLCLVSVVVSLGAFATIGASLGIAAISSCGYLVYKLKHKLSGFNSQYPPTFRFAPLYLIVIPLVLTTVWLSFGHSAAQTSMARVISNSAPLIDDIERYRATHGNYPVTLQSLWEDYKPSIKGVERYHYERSGDAYNLYFEHPSIYLGTREIVMYNRNNEHEFTSHNSDLLTLAGATISRGYYASHDVGTPNWRRFLFD